MATFKVKHIILCKVSAWRTIEADNFDAALLKAAAIECVTDSSTCSYEILDDIKIESITITQGK